MAGIKFEVEEAGNGFIATVEGAKPLVAETPTKLARAIASFITGNAVPRLRKPRKPKETEAQA